MNEGLDSQAALADYLDMSTRNLRDVLAVLKLDWKTALRDEIRIAYIRHLRDKAAGRNDEQLAQVRTRRELAEARLKEIELAELYKIIIRTDDVEPMLIALFKQIQSSINEAGNKALQAIENKHEIKVDDDLVLGHLRAALRNIAAGGDQLVATLSGKPCASVSAAADGARELDLGEAEAARG